jgi:hypothetical protein
MTLLLSSSSSSSSLRRCVCIYFFHFNCCSCLCPDCDDVCVQVCYSLPLSFSFFFSSCMYVFFFDSIDARNGECFMLSLFLLFALLQSTLVAYSYVFLTLHLCVLFRRMPYVFFERVSRHIIYIYIQVKGILWVFSFLNING